MMIKSSVVQYLAECLLSQPHSEYTVRYSLALLLNVSLRCIGESDSVNCVCGLIVKPSTLTVTLLRL